MSIPIRNHTYTRDIRLDRLRQFDPRSRAYPIREIVPKTPRSFSWAIPETWDQGNRGSCVAHGVAHELASRPAVVKGLTSEFILNHIYYEAQRRDPWEGGGWPGATPQYEGTSVIAGVQVAQELGYFDSYRWAFSTEEVVLGLGHNGPVVFGFDWFEGMMDTDENGYIYPLGAVVGGHCVCARAVRLFRIEPKQPWTFANVDKLASYVVGVQSWGKSWGVMNGEFRLTLADLDLLMRQYGEAVFFVDRHSSPQPAT